jgi:hypothetical protein
MLCWDWVLKTTCQPENCGSQMRVAVVILLMPLPVSGDHPDLILCVPVCVTLKSGSAVGVTADYWTELSVLSTRKSGTFCQWSLHLQWNTPLSPGCSNHHSWVLSPSCGPLGHTSERQPCEAHCEFFHVCRMLWTDFYQALCTNVLMFMY